jgi:hypothetical protein
VLIKYRIDARADVRIRQYQEMNDALRAAGFVRTDPDVPEEEAADPRADTMTGTLPSASVPKVVAQRHVRNLLIWPEESKMPAPDTLVRVDVYLDTGGTSEYRRRQARRVVAELGALGFIEAFAYDTEGDTRLSGALKAGSLADALADPLRKLTREVRWLLATAPDKAADLDVHLDHTPTRDDKDREERKAEWRKIVNVPGADALRRIGSAVTVRGRPGDIARKLSEHPRVTFVDVTRRIDVPSTYRPSWPVRVILARPDMDPPPRRPEPPALPEGQEKFTPDLRALLATGGDKPIRLEVLLDHTPGERDDSWVTLARKAGAKPEGRVGPVVTVQAVPKEAAPKLAATPEVLAVRLPRLARSAPALEGSAPAGWSPLRRSGLVQLHEKGKKGRGQRIALIADDFAGWEELPGPPAFIDLTVIRDVQLSPDSFPSAGKGQGTGTRHARQILEAAPEAELTLIRIDPAAPYMLQLAARAINGEVPRSVLLDQRIRELDERKEALSRMSNNVRVLRQIFIDNPPIDQFDKEGVKRRDDYQKAQKEYDDATAELRRRVSRWLTLGRSLRGLKGVTVVASALTWSDGYPVDGSSALSRYFDDRPFSAALWLQAAGDTRGQSWSGLFRDEDDNGLMEFAPSSQRLPPGSWTHEAAWLAWQGKDGKKPLPLPEGPVRIVLQWKEAHDPTPLKVGEDPYRQPLAKLRLLVVRQPDPAGKSRPADDLEVVAQSAGPAVRLEQSLHSATYELTLEVKAGGTGRYGVMIEGKAPESIQPPGEASLPSTRRKGELRLRLSVDSPSASGRPVWAELPASASLGMPADSRGVLAVGAAAADGAERGDSASGVMGAELWAKPDLLAFGTEGTAQAAAFAAGFLAASASKEGSLARAAERIRLHPGKLLETPPGR